MKKPQGFTLIETLVVATVIAILAVAGTVSYVSVNRSSRDSRRKADIEQMRAAFEQWRSDFNAYPTSQVTVACTGASCCTSQVSLVNGGNVYLQSVPRDPQCPNRTYYYTSPNASDYTFGAGLETVTSTCAGLNSPSCGAGINCSYCLGPYGPRP